MRRRHLKSVSAAPYGRCQSIVRIQPQLSGKGVLGRSPKRVLVPFTRVKGTPRRRAVRALHPAKSAPRRRRLQTIPSKKARGTLSSKSRPGGRQEGRYCRLARYCSSRISSWAAVSAKMAPGSAARSSAGVRLPQVISTVGRPRFLPRVISTWESPT